MVCLNLPPELRYDTSFAYLASIVPGPSEPSMEALQSFIRPIADEMEQLHDPGIWVSRTYKYPRGRKVRVSVPLNCMDTPAARAFGGFASHSHTCFCYLCSATLDRIAENTLSSFSLRTVQTHRAQAAQWENAPSLALRNRLFEKNGVRSCEWLRFGWWDMFGGTVIGPMHWTRNILDKQLRRNMNWSWNLPTGIPSPPPLSRPISRLEYEWGQQALYELNKLDFENYKLPEPLVRHLCRERCIYEAGLSARYLMSELNKWRIQSGILSADGHLTHLVVHDAGAVPLSVAKAHYYLSIALKASTLQSHASAQDLEYLCRLFQLSCSGSKLVLAERLIAYYANIRVQNLPNTVSYSKQKKETVSILGVEVLTEIQKDMDQTTLPRWIKHPPKNFGTVSHGKLQSEEYKSLALVSFVITLVRLWGTEPSGLLRDCLDNFLHLMLAVRILSFQSLVESDIVAFEYHYKEYLQGLSKLYPYASRIPTQHMGLHIPGFMRALGPSTRLSESTCEMFIGILQDIGTNFKFGDLELTIHREFIMAARLKGLVEQDSFRSGLGQFGNIVQKYLGGRFPGRLGSGWKTSRIVCSTAVDSDITLILNTWATLHNMPCFPRQVYPCSTIQQGNVVYAPYTHSAGDSCVLFCHPSIVGPQPGRIDTIIEDPDNSRILLLVRPFVPLSNDNSVFDPYWAHPLIGEKGAGIARLYYDQVSLTALVIEPKDMVAHVAVCSYYDSRISQAQVVVLSLDLVS
ncbi:hypothetical protein RHS04_00032 [Rhizoctonia solani]|uniref:Uncharacterized protein n=1 Tax=Rhizoctonia solani TaxID=456999 RepID=A0A8H7HIL0_9AGAM|nr:hypothetical protein RHS04_00032 [Rhizoctonia solani]